MNRRSETIAAGASIETYVEGQARYRGAGTAPVFEIFAALDPFHRCNEWADLRTRYGERITSTVINDASHALFPRTTRCGRHGGHRPTARSPWPRSIGTGCKNAVNLP
jgi:hypothetical protein